MDRTGLEIVIGSTESSTIGNFAVQLAALDGEYSPKTGVSYEGVTRWANRLFESNYILPSASRRTLK
jgi:rhamnulokinase